MKKIKTYNNPLKYLPGVIYAGVIFIGASTTKGFFLNLAEGIPWALLIIGLACTASFLVYRGILSDSKNMKPIQKAEEAMSNLSKKRTLIFGNIAPALVIAYGVDLCEQAGILTVVICLVNLTFFVEPKTE